MLCVVIFLVGAEDLGVKKEEMAMLCWWTKLVENTPPVPTSGVFSKHEKAFGLKGCCGQT